MAANQDATVSVKILVDEEKKRVVCAEAGNDFVDILFSFLTLPMGTIVRLVSKQQSSEEAKIGCMNNLYRSIENLSTAKLWTDACKDMLLHPRNPCETICRGLKVNVDDTGPTKYYICSNLDCIRPTAFLSNYANAKCSCGKLMNLELSELYSGSNANSTENTDGVFLKESTEYVVTDDLKVMPSTPGALVELLSNLGIKDVKRIGERVLKVGSKEILKLLECSLLSESPLTDVFLPNRSSNSKRRISLKPRENQFPPQNVPDVATSEKMVVKILVRKSDRKVLYAEAMEDFVDFLFSFLTIPLANVVGCLAVDSSLGCVDNLYKSVQGMNDMWFRSSPVSKQNSCSNNGLLLNPGLAPKFTSCSSKLFDLQERCGGYYEIRKLADKENAYFIIITYNYVHWALNLMDPKSPKLEKSSGQFVKSPGVFLLSDDLVVLPSSGTISYLKGLNEPIDDVEEHEIQVSKQEALDILKASLITTSALTNVLSHISKKPKQES